jgi:PGF-pre-PGF domain-containing protein
MRINKTITLLTVLVLLLTFLALLLIDQTTTHKGLVIPTSKVISRFSRYWSEVTPDSVFRAYVSKDKIDVARIEFSVTNESKEVDLTIKIPGGFHKSDLLPPGTVRQYFEITPTELTLSSALIGFIVPKSWLLNNSIPENEVNLYRYINGKWNKMVTLFIASNNNFAYYYASSSSFGLFAISGNPKEEDAGEVVTLPIKVQEKVVEELFVEESPQKKPTEELPTEEKPSTVIPVPEKKPNLFIKGGIAILILFIIGTIISLTLIKVRKQEPQQIQLIGQESPELKQRLKELKIYILTSLYQGFSASIIKQELLKIGWKAETVDTVFISVSSDLALLNEFIKKSLAMGIPEEVVKKKLLDQKWDISIVEAALQNYENRIGSSKRMNYWLPE